MTKEQLEKANFLVKTINEMGQFITCEEWVDDKIIATYQDIESIMDAWEERNNMPEGRSYFFYTNEKLQNHYELRLVNDDIAEVIMKYIVNLRKQFKGI